MKNRFKHITITILTFAMLLCGANADGEENTRVITEEETQVTESDIQPVSESSPGSGAVYISEVMIKNHTTIQDHDGFFSDWIELYNSSDSSVDLTGWSMTDHEDGDRWMFPKTEIGPGQYLVIFASDKNYQDERLHTNFALSAKKSVWLYDSNGNVADRFECINTLDDTSIIRNEAGDRIVCDYPTPGYSNNSDGFEQFSSTRNSKGNIQLSEIIVANGGWGELLTNHYSDLVELKNISEQTINLADYYLSDDEDNLMQWKMPEMYLEPGQLAIIYCDNDVKGNPNVAPFSLSSTKERLFITSMYGEIVDYALLENIPLGGSYGRTEEAGGWYYFYTPNLGSTVKSYGFRRVSTKPQASVPAGVYPDAGAITVELTANGSIYYTLDGSDPSMFGQAYTGPITLNSTAVIRAYAAEEGCIPSKIITENYILNTYHDLPVLCINTNNPGNFKGIWNAAIKGKYEYGNASYFAADGGFSSNCRVELKGFTSLDNPKKSMGISFKGIYGSTDLDYDIFGNGIKNYTSLSVRAGQDYPLAMIRNELFQTLCQEISDSVYTQNSQYCVVYLNGKYYGIYCLKENVSRSNYALIDGVEKGDITILKSPVDESSDFYWNVINHFATADMTMNENYEEFCKVFDINSVIDWFILEGYCANTDINGNLKYLYNAQDGLWRFIFYDLDWGFTDINRCFNNVIYSNVQITPMFESLARNEDFKHAVLARYAELYQSYLSNEHVLWLMDELANQVASEMNREKDRWGSSVATWNVRMDQLRRYVTDYDYANYCIKKLCGVLRATDEERMQYFGF